MVIETFPSRLAAQFRLEGLQTHAYDLSSENPEIVLRPLGPEAAAETRWALCVTPAFVRNRVPRLGDALVWCEGFEPFEADARAFTDALIDNGAYLAAGWRAPVTAAVAQHVAAELLARLSAGKPFETSLVEVGSLPLVASGPTGDPTTVTVGDLFTFEPRLHGDYQLTLGAPVEHE